MTASFIQDYYELICLTRQFLAQEHPVVKAPSTVLPAPLPTQTRKEAPQPVEILPEKVHKVEAPKIEKVETPLETPAPKQTPAPPPQKNRSVVSLEPAQPAENGIWKELGPFMQKEFPGVAVRQEIPSDEAAKKLRNSWKEAFAVTDVVLLTFQEPPNHSAFLAQVANAISVVRRPAKLLSALKIEQENGWEAFLADPGLKLIIASDYAIYNLPQLMRHYRESSKTAEYFLGKVPLFLLADLSLYLREPLLKSSLWKALSRAI